MDILEVLAERKIKDAMEKGDFDKILGKGKPLVLEDLSYVSPDNRMVYKILKQAGVLPQEVVLKKNIYELKKQIGESNSEEEKKFLRTKLNEIITEYNIMMERNRRR